MLLLFCIVNKRDIFKTLLAIYISLSHIIPVNHEVCMIYMCFLFQYLFKELYENQQQTPNQQTVQQPVQQPISLPQQSFPGQQYQQFPGHQQQYQHFNQQQQQVPFQSPPYQPPLQSPTGLTHQPALQQIPVQNTGQPLNNQQLPNYYTQQQPPQQTIPFSQTDFQQPFLDPFPGQELNTHIDTEPDMLHQVSNLNQHTQQVITLWLSLV